MASELLSLPAENAPSPCTSDALPTSPTPVAAPQAPASAAFALAHSRRFDSPSPLLASSPPALPIATTGLSLRSGLPAYGTAAEASR